MSRFTAGEIYDRRDIHNAAKLAGLRPGNANAGITNVGSELCVFWNPYRRLYANRWIVQPEEFLFSGEGSVGAMAETSGNRALREAENGDRPVTVFYKVERTGSVWRCLGQYDVVEHELGVSVDADGEPRPDVRFRLFAQNVSNVGSLPQLSLPAAQQSPNEGVLWDAVEKILARKGSRRRRGPISAKNRRQSDPVLTLYVVRRAIQFGGVCESCLESPGWVDDNGEPHFQAHHILPDVDLVDWIGALCGTCHDRMHHGTDRQARAEALRTVVKNRQQQLGRVTVELDSLPFLAH